MCANNSVLSGGAIHEKYHIGKITTINLVLERKECWLTRAGMV